MEHTASTFDIIINILFQLLNIALFFFLFIKFAGKALTDALDKKIAQEKKLAAADKEYALLIAKAQEEKQQMMEDALAHKKQLVTEATTLAKQEKEKILTKATHEAKIIIDKAEQDAAIKDRDLESHFATWVKSASMAVVKKLFASKKDIQESYLNGLVDEFASSYKK